MKRKTGHETQVTKLIYNQETQTAEEKQSKGGEIKMNNDNLIRIYSGTEVLVLMLQEMLEENDIGAMVRNDFQSGVAAGFVAGLPTSVDLYIREADLAGAESILAAFLEENPEEEGSEG